MLKDDDVLPLELSLADCRRLLEIVEVGASEQDIRILTELRRAIANGKP